MGSKAKLEPAHAVTLSFRHGRCFEVLGGCKFCAIAGGDHMFDHRQEGRYPRHPEMFPKCSVVIQHDPIDAEPDSGAAVLLFPHTSFSQ